MPPSTTYAISALPGVPEASADGVLVASPRGRMLDAMTATVAELGYAATSIAEVIKRAHASRSTFYEQFADKEDCYLAAYQLVSNYIATKIATAAQSSPPNLADRLAQIYETYLDELARIPLAARAFHIEIRAAGAPSQQHHRAVKNQFADLLLVPGGDDDPLMRIAAIAASEEIVVREIADNGTENLPRLAAPLTDLAMRILTPGTDAGRPR